MMKSMDEKKGLLENIKAEEIPMSNSTFSDQIPTSATFAAAPNFIDSPIPSFEGGGGGGSWESFGFTDMLTNFLPDNPFTSVYDFVFQNPQTNFQSLLVRQPTPTPPPRATNNNNNNNNNNAPPESSEVVNTPATPNSSSISTSSSEAQNDDQQNNKTTVDGEQEDQDQEKTKKQLKPIKKNQKRKKEPRFAFVTKSEVDHLDDGYRWRKYGQKAVKNSPFPRSYYRCTSPSCGVKKRVERSSTDSTTVVTTYEGTHIHPIPLTSRGSLGFVPETTASSFFSGPSGGGGGGGNSGPSSFFLPPMPPRYQQQQHQQLPFFQEPSSASSFVHMIQESGYCPPPPPPPSSSLSSALFMDNGLLEDIVPSQMLIKELKKE